MLYSATSTKKTEDLIKVALKKEPIYIGLEDQNQDGAATVMGLEQVRHEFNYFKRRFETFILQTRFGFTPDILRDTPFHLI